MAVTPQEATEAASDTYGRHPVLRFRPQAYSDSVARRAGS
jgi:hypothetical protein